MQSHSIHNVAYWH